MNIDFKKFILGLVIFLVLIFACQLWQGDFFKKINPLEITFFDVGQGDAALITYLGQYQILVDGGQSGEILLEQLREELPWQDKQIELVILTHPDADHLSGLVDVFDYYQAGLFLSNGQKAATEIYQSLESKLEEKGIRQEVIGEGSSLNLGNYLKLSFYNPDELAGIKADRNDSSVVFRMDYGENTFLFTGDAEALAEKDMIEDEEDIDIEYLKVGHHGSKNATSSELLKAATPQYAIISAGKGNRYGHPTPEVLERLEAAQTQIFRTDERGDIKIICQKPQEECKILE